jgi:hypothetical protein
LVNSVYASRACSPARLSGRTPRLSRHHDALFHGISFHSTAFFSRLKVVGIPSISSRFPRISFAPIGAVKIQSFDRPMTVVTQLLQYLSLSNELFQ